MAGLMEYLSNLKFEPDAKSMGLMNMAANMLQASNNSPTPVSFGNALGAGLNGFTGGYQVQKNLDDTAAAAEQKKLLDAATINHLNAQSAHELNKGVDYGVNAIHPGAIHEKNPDTNHWQWKYPDGTIVNDTNDMSLYQRSNQDAVIQGNIASAKEGPKTNSVKMNDGSTQMLTNSQANPNYNYGFIREPNKTTGFQSFASPQEGIAGIDKNLQAYGSQHGINTLAGVISRWSPPNENDTPNLIKNAAQRLGIGPDDPIDLNNPVTRHLVSSAIMMQEQPRTNLFPAPQGNGLSIGISTANEANQKKIGESQALASIDLQSRLSMYDQVIADADKGIAALGASEAPDKLTNKTVYSLNTGGYFPGLQKTWNDSVSNDPRYRDIEQASAMSSLKSAQDYLKGQGTITDAERSLVKEVGGIDPYKYTSEQNHSMFKIMKERAVKAKEAAIRASQGDFSNPPKEEKPQIKRSVNDLVNQYGG